MELKIATGKVDVDDVLTEAEKYVDPNLIDIVVNQVYLPSEGVSDRTEALSNAKRELVCDGADHINQLRYDVDNGALGFADLADVIDEVIGGINRAANELTDGAFELEEESTSQAPVKESGVVEKENAATKDGVRYSRKVTAIDSTQNENLELRGEPKNKPKSASEWSAFNRSFSNQTSEMKTGEEKRIVITTADHIYFVTADGYMKGYAEQKLAITYDVKKILNARKAFLNETNKNAETFGSWAEVVRADRRRAGSNISVASNGDTTDTNGELPFESPERIRTGYIERSKPDYENNSITDNNSFVESAPVLQRISSEKTSIKQIPALFKDKNVSFGKINIDIGGGRFDLATGYLASIGTRNMVFDPYNRSVEVNSDTLTFLQSGKKADTATCANVLNVIAEPEARANVILEMAKAIKNDGIAYFMVYEGNGSGIGRETSVGYQNNRKTADYVSEISEYFNDVQKKGKLIIAKDPVSDLPKASWEIQPGEAVAFSRRIQTLDDLREENDALREKLGELKGSEALAARKTRQAAYWKGQTKRTAEPSVRQSEIDRVAKSIIKDYSSTIDAKEISGRLKALGDYIVRDGDGNGKLTWEGIKERALDIARDVIQNAQALIADEDDIETFRNIKSYLRSTRLSYEDQGDIADYNDFRKRNIGRFTIAKNGIPVDTAYQELTTKFGESYFPSDITNPSDQLLHIAEIFEQMQLIYENPYSADMAEATEYCANEIIDELWIPKIKEYFSETKIMTIIVYTISRHWKLLK